RDAPVQAEYQAKGQAREAQCSRSESGSITSGSTISEGKPDSESGKAHYSSCDLSEPSIDPWSSHRYPEKVRWCYR
ncbi:MAG: hypothetical protein Q8M37_08165, partial [Nevskia sp.]|nr:hypothetical protein [Nevskia sp.]